MYSGICSEIGLTLVEFREMVLGRHFLCVTTSDDFFFIYYDVFPFI